MHRMWRAGSYNGIHWILFQILTQIPHTRANPSRTRVGHEQIAPQAHHQALLESLLLLVERIHSGALVGSAEKLMIDGVRLGNVALEHGNVGRNLFKQTLVHGQLFGVLGSVDHRLPAELAQVLGELYPALHAAAPGWRPVVTDYQNFLHRL